VGALRGSARTEGDSPAIVQRATAAVADFMYRIRTMCRLGASTNGFHGGHPACSAATYGNAFFTR